ncbi:MAG: hypothetical protein M0Z67_02810 [Nitrospiraceae bacterium]|nr:hypothetical protein [Nitrospiraceae bacterium]
MPDKWIERDLDLKVKDILSQADIFHEKYYSSETFSGPSLHFHHRAIALECTNWTEKVEIVYAVLASWGMHRMGTNGSKMQSFSSFEKSISSVRPEIEKLRKAVPRNLLLSDWQTLERVFKRIKVMASGTTIVGNSKVLAHFIPNLIAPIDREYTLNYLFGSKMFQNGLDREWLLMCKIHREFYYSISDNKDFQNKTESWMSNSRLYPWDTSVLKIIDNLVIGAMRKKNDSD